MLIYDRTTKSIIEKEYHIKDEAHHAALLTTGNGYFGVRGSFEEFGSVNVQGTFIRGVFDQIVEIPNLYVDNIYMRKYYLNELEAKKFEYQDSAINVCDFLYLQFKVGDHIFFPWEGRMLSWKRYIDTQDGSLVRDVLWDDGFGNITEFKYKRFASFDNHHQYILSASIKKINHDLPCEVVSGLDIFIKTNGQKKSKLVAYQRHEHSSYFNFYMGDLYNHEVSLGIDHTLEGFEESHEYVNKENGIYAIKSEMTQGLKEATVHKYIYGLSNIDIPSVKSLKDEVIKGIISMKSMGYHTLYKKHLLTYQQAFEHIDIEISDEEDNAYLKYANYQTLISIDRFTDVHSLSAKSLTGQKYNQFVWWDAEIFQFPIYLMTMPLAAKKTLMYRYHRLQASKENAKKLGLDGAKYAFCSSVLGDEKVWAYARHPFMQIHINADIAYAIISYTDLTGDTDFLLNYGFEMLIEISKYWLSRVIYNSLESIYELKEVAGTDEHHPYIDNNAYTNYLVAYTLNRTLKYVDDFPNLLEQHDLKKELLDQIKHIVEHIKKPLNKDGKIPQFDGYFELNPELVIEGFGAAKGFQMKESGLYHESQIIKQPDVMMLYSYINLPGMPGDYKKNWAYYEQKCEASSSLTYPVHAVCAIDHLEFDKFYQYWETAIKIDILDHHHEAHLGLHAASIAGGWYAIFRGLFGIKPFDNFIEINPKPFKKWKKVSIQFMYKGNILKLSLDGQELTIESNAVCDLLFHGRKIKHHEKTVLTID